MKNLMTVLMFILPFTFVSGQENDFYLDIDKYKTKPPQDSDFEERFQQNEDKQNFKRLREYLREKEDICDAIRFELRNYYDASKDVEKCNMHIDKLNDLIKNQPANAKVEVPAEILSYYLYDDRYQGYRPMQVQVDDNANDRTIHEVKDLIVKYEQQKKQFEEMTLIYQCLRDNLKVVKQDIYSCRSQIDSALAPEYKNQKFRLNISICFTALIGVLLICFFVIIYRRSDANLYKELLSGNGLQFITLFVLIIAVILFGILSILQGSELAAILAGISGYILGKEKSPQAVITPVNNNNPGNTNPANPENNNPQPPEGE